MAEFGDLDFHVTPLDTIKSQNNDSDSAQRQEFCIRVVATFMPPLLDDDDEDSEDESWLCNDIEYELKEREFSVPRDQLLHVDEEISRSTVSGILRDMNVPIRAFMINGILTCACQMANDNNFNSSSGCKVLYNMRVNIDVPPGFEESFNDDYDGETLNFVPASPSSIEALQSVKVEEGSNANTSCSVCFEKFRIGSEATRLPCSHIYHYGCIRSWLGNSKFCPLCRYEIS